MTQRLIRLVLVALMIIVFGWLVTEPTNIFDWLVKLPLLAILYGCFKVLDDFIPESIKKENYDAEEN